MQMLQRPRMKLEPWKYQEPFYISYFEYCEKKHLNPEDLATFNEYYRIKLCDNKNNNKMTNIINNNLGALNNDIVNLTFTTAAGYRVIIPASKNMTFKLLFINYANKVGVPLDAIKTKIIFLYNTERVDTKSN